MTWNTDHVTPGDYSVQVVTQDIITGLRVAAEMRLRIIEGDQPLILGAADPIPPDVIYVSQGSNSTSSFITTSGQSVVFLTTPPDGFIADISEDNSSELV